MEINNIMMVFFLGMLPCHPLQVMEQVKGGENDTSIGEEPNAKRHRGDPTVHPYGITTLSW